MNEHITDKDYYPLPTEGNTMREDINSDTQTITRTVYAVAWETDDGRIIQSFWDYSPSASHIHLLAEIELTYQIPANLDFVRSDKSERIAMLKSELAKLEAS
jgi:hypothetical protein